MAGVETALPYVSDTTALAVVEKPAAAHADTSADGQASPTAATELLAEASAIRSAKFRTLTWVQVAFIAYAFTAAGPFGMEAAVHSGGPLLTLIGLIVFPLMYVLPQIVVVTEMATMMPTSHGPILWVQRAFGDFWGYFNSILTALMGLVDVPVYAKLFADYIAAAFIPDASYWTKIGLSTCCLWVGTAMALGKARLVGHMSTALAFIVMAPFLVGIIAGLHLINGKSVGRVEPYAKDGYDFGLLMSTLAWLLTGWRNLGSLGGEVTGPKSFLVGMPLALFFAMLTYILPLLVAVSVPVPPGLPDGPWQGGYLATAFDQVLPHLGKVIAISGASGSLGLLASSMVCYPRTLWGVAERGFAPRILTLRSKTTHAPWAAVLFHFVVASVLLLFHFTALIQVEIVVSAPSVVLSMVCLAKLRRSEPDAPRPLMWPKSFIGSCVLVGMPTFLFAVLIVMNFELTGFIAIGVVLLVAMSHRLYERFRDKTRKIRAVHEIPMEEIEP